MKAPYMIYADFKCLLRKIQGCKPPKDRSICISHAGSLPKLPKRRETSGAGSIQRGRHCIRLVRKHPERMQAYMGKKTPPVMTPKDLQKHKTRPTATSVRRASSRTWFWRISLSTIPVLVDIAAKATEDDFTTPFEKLESRDRKEKEKKKTNRPMDSKNQRNMPVLRRAFADKENTRTQ